ncbi:GntR family transcriptional regulator [Bradyrhizobium tropiciagri]|uniref:GntR family transcriptional regulator n=1 Tax=Bradyrhizobium tropiciagri TaxID=312253 RepID=UPI001BAD5B12|nr:GntR family transcriptional regulator [Bradyrhizobium tropiciagri]MBR0873298.1 GntR family transcriptional regulator [Bradyrhizobium tropiciagri]
MKVRKEQKRLLAAEIGGAILQGDYRPGEWLRQIDLEEAFAAKRFDVRSALTQLAASGMVTHVENRGYRVAQPDYNVVREILAIRSLLEVEAATQALPNIGPTELDDIKRAQQAFEDAVARGSKADQANTNAAFHDEIYRHAPNQTLAKLVVEIRNRARPGPIALWPSYAELQRSAAHHVEIVDAIEARDLHALLKAVRRHILESGANYPAGDGHPIGHRSAD